MTKYQVSGDLADIENLLRSTLTREEMAILRIELKPKSISLSVPPRRAEPVSTVLIWVGEAVAAGMTYDVLKAISMKVWHVLETRYGKDKVKKDESDK
ncbi:hypothetical protein AFK24_15680 [Pseudomonas syringae]|uniref:Uncharacterized protein n=1 Tax=Pseudomonas syringae TaxID=317 RepID=A0A1C7Z6U9_PSESX|nr:hypothetical protein [Pseudomonas syringae]OCR24188.1 hypothetical protein AFK24_15680 [Pseudomonas syringae]